jgi:N-acetyl-anhydromuramyl-L-alanine amidase AmpD
MIDKIAYNELRVASKYAEAPRFEIPGYSGIVYNGENKHYYEEETEKHGICLHYTAGQILGDLPTLTGDRGHVSTAYLIGRDGITYQLFDPKYWSYHLGPYCVGGNGRMSKRWIGIEISNYGWLSRRGDNLYTWAGSKYCSIKDTEHYTQTPTFRGKQYWASLTDDQYFVLNKLLIHLSDKFNIPLRTLRPERRLEYNPISTKDNRQLIFDKGVFTHANVRKDKWDIGPAFEWEKLKCFH